MSITIKLASVFVNDQSKALEFYTEKLGFEICKDVLVGEFRWLTVSALNGSSDIELVLEPNNNPAASTYQQSIYEQGIPATALFCDDVESEFDRLTALGVKFVKPATEMPWGSFAVLDDTCGNLIQIQQVNG